jgi:hypothetical protein
VWGWLAGAVESREVTLKLTTEWTNEWISVREHQINSLRADAAWAETPGEARMANALADREETTGAIRTWLLVNEEP